MIFLLLLACSQPTTVAGCTSLRDETKREECRFDLLEPLLPPPGASSADRKAFQAALEAALTSIDDPRSRDLLLLRLAIASPASAGYLCTKVQTDGARERCQQVLGRPHLGTVPKAPSNADQGVMPPTAGPTPSHK